MVEIMPQDEFLNNWFPDLDNKSYIIPTTHLRQIQANNTNYGDVPTKEIKPDYTLSRVQIEIKELDKTHEKVHSLFDKLKDQEVMVMMTQASFSMYSSPVQAARASLSDSGTRDVPLEDIKYQKSKHSDLVMVNKLRCVPVCPEQNVHASDPNSPIKRLEKAVIDLKRDACTTLVPKQLTSNITRVQLKVPLKLTIEHALFEKNEMVTEKGLECCWEGCRSTGHLPLKDSDTYVNMVASFARKRNHWDSGDDLRDTGFQAVVDLYQPSLFSQPNKMLDFDNMDRSAEEMIEATDGLHGMKIRLRNVKGAHSPTIDASEEEGRQMTVILCLHATVKSTNKLCSGRVDLLVGDVELLKKKFRQMLGIHATVVETCTVPIPQKLGNRQQLHAEVQIIGKEKQFWAHCRSVDGEIALEEEQRLEIGALVGKLLTTGRSLPVSAHWCLATTDGLPHDLEVQVQLSNVNDVALETIGSKLLTLTAQVSSEEAL